MRAAHPTTFRRLGARLWITQANTPAGSVLWWGPATMPPIGTMSSPLCPPGVLLSGRHPKSFSIWRPRPQRPKPRGFILPSPLSTAGPVSLLSTELFKLLRSWVPQTAIMLPLVIQPTASHPLITALTHPYAWVQMGPGVTPTWISQDRA